MNVYSKACVSFNIAIKGHSWDIILQYWVNLEAFTGDLPDMCRRKWDRFVRVVSKHNRCGMISCDNNTVISLSIFLSLEKATDKLLHHLVSSLEILHLHKASMKQWHTRWLSACLVMRLPSTRYPPIENEATLDITIDELKVQKKSFLWSVELLGWSKFMPSPPSLLIEQRVSNDRPSLQQHGRAQYHQWPWHAEMQNQSHPVRVPCWWPGPWHWNPCDSRLRPCHFEPMAFPSLAPFSHLQQNDSFWQSCLALGYRLSLKQQRFIAQFKCDKDELYVVKRRWPIRYVPHFLNKWHALCLNKLSAIVFAHTRRPGPFLDKHEKWHRFTLVCPNACWHASLL